MNDDAFVNECRFDLKSIKFKHFSKNFEKNKIKSF